MKVGLHPSEGSGLVELDSDKDLAAKITNKNGQDFMVVATNGEAYWIDTYDLSGLTLEEPVSV